MTRRRNQPGPWDELSDALDAVGDATWAADRQVGSKARWGKALARSLKRRSVGPLAGRAARWAVWRYLIGPLGRAVNTRTRWDR